MGKPCRFMAISEIELYKFAPWDLPDMSCLRTKDLEWYFFCPRDKKYPNGYRANRSTEIGYWKVTGKDRNILHDSRIVGMKKSLIFHTGKPPKGDRTDWVMYEYRLSDDRLATSGVVQDAYVICKIFKKSGLGPKIGEQYGAPFNDEDWEDDADPPASVAAFPFLTFYDQPSNGNCASTSIAGPVPMLLDATAVPLTVDATAVPLSVAVDPVPESTAAFAIGEPESLSVAISTRMYEELPITTGPTFGMPHVTDIPYTSEMDGIQLDELAAILLDSPYRPNYVSVSSQPAAQQPSPAEVNFSEPIGELAYPLDALPMDGNGAASTGTSLAAVTGCNTAELAPSELGSQNYIELNDILFGPEDDYFPDYSYAATSPDIDVDVNDFFSNGPSTSDSQNGGPT